VPADEPHRPGPPVRLRSATGPPSLPAGDSSAGAKKGPGPQVVGFVRLSSTRTHRPNPRRRRIGGRADHPPPASRPGSCANPRSASQPGPPDRRIAVRSRKRNAISPIDSQFVPSARTSWGTFPTCHWLVGTLETCPTLGVRDRQEAAKRQGGAVEVCHRLCQCPFSGSAE